MALQSQWLTTVFVNGEEWGPFDTFSGGDKSHTVTAHRPGGSCAERKYPSPARYGNVTVGRTYEHERDHGRAVSELKSLRSPRVRVARTPLDEDCNVFDSNGTISYEGFLEDFNPGDSDSNSDDLMTLQMTVSVEKVV